MPSGNPSRDAPLGPYPAHPNRPPRPAAGASRTVRSVHNGTFLRPASARRIGRLLSDCPMLGDWRKAFAANYEIPLSEADQPRCGGPCCMISGPRRSSQVR